MKRNLNLKNMKEALINYSGIKSEFDKIWDTFWQMATMDFISRETWLKFYEECKGWYITDDGDEVRDSEHDDRVIWVYGEEPYRA